MNNNYIIEYYKWLNNKSLDDKSKDLLLKMDLNEIEDSFYKKLTLGTAGMRGIIGVGTNRFNIYTLRRANYGYAKFLMKSKKNLFILNRRGNKQLYCQNGGLKMRDKITLACTECKQRNYDTKKNKKNDPDRIEMKKYIAEFLGTLVLVLFGTGIAVVSGGDLVATSLAFGLAIVAEAYVIGSISGCHVNPAVSIAHVITGRMSLFDCVYYVVAQIVGGIVGAALLAMIMGSTASLGANFFEASQAISLGAMVTAQKALMIEIILMSKRLQ